MADRIAHRGPLLQSVPPIPPSSEHAAELLRERIVAGALPRGRSLPRYELARSIGASPAVTSAALDQLVAQNFAVRRGRNLVVAPLRLEAQALVAERLRLEPDLTRRAVRRIAELDLYRLERMQRDMQDAQRRGDIEAVQRCNYRFHVTLYRLADRPETLRRVQALWAGFPFDMLTTLPGRMRAVADEHIAILQALRDADPVRAGRAMRAHIRLGWQAFLRYYPRCPAAARETRRTATGWHLKNT